MKQLLITLVLAVLAPVFLCAQPKRPVPPIVEIADVESSENALAVFAMNADGQSAYYLNVGQLGAGDDVLQILFDPVDMLFIPLGATMSEALATLQELEALYAGEPGATLEIEACFAPVLPDQSREMATVTMKKRLFCRQLAFVLQRDGYIRSTYVTRSDFRNLMMNVKWNAKTHTDLF